MSTAFLNALIAYDKVFNDNEKLRETVRYFFAKYPAEALTSIGIIKPDFAYLDGVRIGSEHLTHMRNLIAQNTTPHGVSGKINAIKYCRALRVPSFGLKDAKDFVETYCV